MLIVGQGEGRANKPFSKLPWPSRVVRSMGRRLELERSSMEEDRKETSQNHTQTGSNANIRTQVQGCLAGS